MGRDPGGFGSGFPSKFLQSGGARAVVGFEALVWYLCKGGGLGNLHLRRGFLVFYNCDLLFPSPGYGVTKSAVRRAGTGPESRFSPHSTTTAFSLLKSGLSVGYNDLGFHRIGFVFGRD